MDFINERIEQIQTDLIKYCELETKLIESGGVTQYQLNSGQTTTQATQLSLNSVRSIIKDLQSELFDLQNMLNGGNFTVLRG